MPLGKCDIQSSLLFLAVTRTIIAPQSVDEFRAASNQSLLTQDPAKAGWTYCGTPWKRALGLGRRSIPPAAKATLPRPFA